MNEPRSTRYQRLRRRARVASLISGLAVLAVLALTPASGFLAALAASPADGLSAVPRAVVSLILFIAAALLLCELAAMPALLYSTLRVGRRYGVQDERHSAEDVVGARIQSTMLLLPVVVTAAAVVQAAVWAAGSAWWLAAGVMLAAGSVLALREAPGVIARLSGARPLERGALGHRLEALADRARTPVAAILEVPAAAETGTTALVAGIGRSRRVFIASDVARDWTDDEIAVVVAHELGHCAHQDAWKTMAVDAVLLCVALGAAELARQALAPAFGLPAAGSIAALPFIALVAGLVWIAATPLRHAQSRRHERRADAFALALTGGADAFDAAIRRLGARHLAEERPDRLTRWLFHRHPSVGERLEYARTYRALMRV